MGSRERDDHQREAMHRVWWLAYDPQPEIVEARRIRDECERLGLPMGYGRVTHAPVQLTWEGTTTESEQPLLEFLDSPPWDAQSHAIYIEQRKQKRQESEVEQRERQRQRKLEHTLELQKERARALDLHREKQEKQRRLEEQRAETIERRRIEKALRDEQRAERKRQKARAAELERARLQKLRQEAIELRWAEAFQKQTTRATPEQISDNSLEAMQIRALVLRMGLDTVTAVVEEIRSSLRVW